MALTLDISTIGAEGRLLISNTENLREKVSIQIEPDGTFNGTTTCVNLQESNVNDATDKYWADFGFQKDLVAGGTTLLRTDEFYSDFVALKVIKGDATAGILTITTNYKD